ncbi:MAG TPA: YihY/virulence factor BrkB family protein [Actinomycetales bacterium]|nr:YihY/virulence factor BrkB family protein [Actinomycetales bacterium]
MSAGTASGPGVLARLAGLRRSRLVLGTWALTRATIAICMRYRVTGLASEAGFFALLSLPPLILGIFGGVGYVGGWLGEDTVAAATEQVRHFASRFLTEPTVNQTIIPTVNDVFTGRRADIISLGFLLSVWSGSRVLNVFVDTISIMYGQGGDRGIVRTRLLSLSLYAGGLVIGAVIFPLVLLGPSVIQDLLPDRLEFLLTLYWPVVVLLTLASLASLYHIAVPRRSHWRRDLPGAMLALVIWVGSSFVLRWVLTHSVGDSSTSIYGPLAAPIVVLIWLYFLAIAVLIGAGLNAASRQLWPPEGTSAQERRRLAASARPGTLTPVHEPDDEMPGAPTQHTSEAPARPHPALHDAGVVVHGSSAPTAKPGDGGR